MSFGYYDYISKEGLARRGLLPDGYIRSVDSSTGYPDLAPITNGFIPFSSINGGGTSNTTAASGNGGILGGGPSEVPLNYSVYQEHDLFTSKFYHILFFF